MPCLLRATVTAIAVAGLALGSAACTRERAGDTRPKIAFVVANCKLNFANEMMYGFSFGATGVGGVDYVIDGPPTVDGPRYVQILRKLTLEAKDGVSVFSLAPELSSPPLAAAAREGVPLIAVDNPPDPTSGVRLYVGNDNYKLGQMLANEAIRRLPPNASGKVLLGTSTPGVPVLDLRAQGMRDQFHRRLPGVRVLGPFDTKQDVDANKTAWEDLASANPDALAFLGTGDADGWNLAKIRQKTRGKWLAGAYDLDQRSLKAVRADQLLLVSPEHFVKGAIAGRLQAEHARHGTTLPHGWIYTPGLAVNQTNIDEIMKRQTSPATRAAWFNKQINTILTNQETYLRPLGDAH